MKNDVGTFMVGVGGIIECTQDGTILLMKRSDHREFLAGVWEFLFGRVSQFETEIDGLKREVFEETGIKDLEIIKPIHTWHIFRGEKKKENELIGITYWMKTPNKDIVMSDEHSAYKWVTISEAKEILTHKDMLKELDTYMKEKGAHNA